MAGMHIASCSRASVACAALLILFAQSTLAQAAGPGPALAQTAQGTVQGELAGTVLAFRGIPYAAPPVGELRFRPPRPPRPWSGVRAALDMSPACPQLIDDDPTENNHAVMSEDCLTLNIWTPHVDAARRPVMVWIHGGGFTVGSTRNTWYNGQYLAARGDVVVVSINYRLGAWGFLDLSSFGAGYAGSANAGLLDQVAALRWVRDNIREFGGDPENITIFGESAGASSVGDLLSMPETKGLFARVILESGLPGGRTGSMSNRHQHLTQTFLDLLKVRTTDELGRKTMRELLDAQQRLFATTTDIGTFGPSVDGVVLKERPFTVITEGRAAQVPVLIGTTMEEMRYFATAEDIGIEQKPRALLLKQLADTAGAHAADVLATYQRLYPVWGDTVVQIASDAFLRLPTIQLAEAASAYQPVYVYLFAYRSTSTYKNFGSAHAMELPFVFGTVDLPEVIAFTGRDPQRHKVANSVMDSWIAFARSGNPALPSGAPWPRYDKVTRPTMILGADLHVENDPLSEQRLVWGGNFPTVEQAWKLLQENH
jgi:para-nitrobenzyl esterase